MWSSLLLWFLLWLGTLTSSSTINSKLHTSHAYEKSGTMREFTTTNPQLHFSQATMESQHNTARSPHFVHEWQTCSPEGRCHCLESRANCSYTDLTYIPRLPASITQLDFSHAGLGHRYERGLSLTLQDLAAGLELFKNVMENTHSFTAALSRARGFTCNNTQLDVGDDFFANATGVTNLTLAYNCIQHISAHAFDPVRNLTYLDVSYNNLNFTSLAPILSIPTLQTLDLEGAITELLHSEMFENYSMPSLEKLDLSTNFFKNFSLRHVAHFPRLRDLDLSSIFLFGFGGPLFFGTRGLNTDFLPHLQVLSLEANVLSRFPETCRNNQSLFPSLVTLNLSGQLALHTIPETLCLPNLQKLILNGNSFVCLRRTSTCTSFDEDLFPSLTTLELSSQFTDIFSVKGVHMDETAFRLPSLQSLDLSFNDFLIFGREKSVAVDSFSGCSSLQKLSLAHTNFTGVNQERFQRLFAPLSNLTQLSLKSTGIDFITAGMFRGMTSLRSLDLSHNKLIHLPEAVFDSLTFLADIDLSHNQIATMAESSFSLGIRQQLQHVDLRLNRFVCWCDLRWFQHWLVSDPALFGNPSTGYDCDNLPNSTVQTFYVQEQACLLSQETSKFIIASVSLLISLTTVVSLLYRYRWHIRLAVYEAFRGRGELRLRRYQEQEFQYDVFVSYDSEDFEWVHDHLMRELEEGMGLRLCLHERDFTPGAPIVQNIEESVQASKKMMMIFSRGFAESEWCQFELQLCLRHVMDYDDALLVVLLDEIPPRDLTAAMMAVMRTTTYIEWGEEADARESFWRRMQLALEEILPQHREEFV